HLEAVEPTRDAQVDRLEAGFLPGPEPMEESGTPAIGDALECLHLRFGEVAPCNGQQVGHVLHDLEVDPDPLSVDEAEERPVARVAHVEAGLASVVLQHGTTVWSNTERYVFRGLMQPCRK